MQVKKEQLLNDIQQIERQIEQAKASVHQMAGAIAALKGMLEYLDKPEPTSEEIEAAKVLDGAKELVEKMEEAKHG